jgi:hypothetical protein
LNAADRELRPKHTPITVRAARAAAPRCRLIAQLEALGHRVMLQEAVAA